MLASTRRFYTNASSAALYRARTRHLCGGWSFCSGAVASMANKIRQASQRGAVAVPTISIDRLRPHRPRYRTDSGAFPPLDGPPDRGLAVQGLGAQCTDVGEELAGAAGGVGADEDRGAMVMLVGDLGERGVEPVLSQNASIGWKPKVCLFSELLLIFRIAGGWGCRDPRACSGLVGTSDRVGRAWCVLRRG
jgi:hypothetical protein